MPAGRPTDYTPELVAKARKYIDGGWERLCHKIPSHSGLALFLDMSRKTLYRWALEEGKEEIKDILEKCMVQQEQLLISNGLDNTFNSAITKLVLGKHGYHEKKDTELTGSGGGAIDMKWTVEIVDCKE